jgi:hypothetical protein
MSETSNKRMMNIPDDVIFAAEKMYIQEQAVPLHQYSSLQLLPFASLINTNTSIYKLYCCYFIYKMEYEAA